MEDWEDEPILPPLKKEQLKNSWDEEDVDENDVKDSWEDEEETVLAPAPVPVPVPAPPAENVPKKKSAKVNVQKGKTVVVKEVPLDPLAEKLCQERLVEEADFKSTRDLFNRRGDEKTLDDFIPKSESDFLEYAELISHKLQPYEKSFHYIGLLKAVMRLSMTSLKAADAKEVASSITAIANEKLKAEKEANAGKKKPGAKKKQLHVDKPDDDVVVTAYDGYDDYDFIVCFDGISQVNTSKHHRQPPPSLYSSSAQALYCAGDEAGHMTLVLSSLCDLAGTEMVWCLQD
ncbi:unnamed protein product [Camellia sinensis]